MTKEKLFYIVTLFVIGVCLISGIFIPETGRFVLLKEFFDVLLMFCVALALGKALPAIYKSKKYLTAVLVTIVCTILCSVTILKSIDTLKDIVSGAETVTLYNCSVEQRTSLKGIWGQHYYLNGIDFDGTKYRFEISGNNYNFLRETDEVTVTCYKNTERIVEFKNE